MTLRDSFLMYAFGGQEASAHTGNARSCATAAARALAHELSGFVASLLEGQFARRRERIEAFDGNGR